MCKQFTHICCKMCVACKHPVWFMWPKHSSVHSITAQQTNKNLSLFPLNVWECSTILKLEHHFQRKNYEQQTDEKNSFTCVCLHHFLEGFAWTKTNTMMNSKAVWALDHQKSTPDDRRWKLVSIRICCYFVSGCTTTIKWLECFDVKIKHELRDLI